MSIAQISPGSVLANPSHINPVSQTVQHAASAQATQTAQAAVVKSRSDTVKLSSQALKMNSRANKFSDESRDRDAGKPAEKAGRKG